MPTMLSPHFSLAEMTRSDVATRYGMGNLPPAIPERRLRELCLNVLEPLRAHFEKPIRINSGYRSPAVNKRVGGSPASQHVAGEAADIEIDGISNLHLAQTIIALKLPFDQLILEGYKAGEANSGWVHVSHRPEPRRQVLTATFQRGPTAGNSVTYTNGLPAK